MLTEPSVGLATPSQLGKVVGQHRSRVHEYRTRYRAGGAEALEVKRRGPRGASKLTGSRLARAPALLNDGPSNYQVAARVGVSEQTIRKGIKEGRLVRPPAGRGRARRTPTGSVGCQQFP